MSAPVVYSNVQITSNPAAITNGSLSTQIRSPYQPQIPQLYQQQQAYLQLHLQPQPEIPQQGQPISFVQNGPEFPSKAGTYNINSTENQILVNGQYSEESSEEQQLQDEQEAQQQLLRQQLTSSPDQPVYNTKIRHGFAADYESEQYMNLLAEVCLLEIYIYIFI